VLMLAQILRASSVAAMATLAIAARDASLPRAAADCGPGELKARG